MTIFDAVRTLLDEERLGAVVTVVSGDRAGDKAVAAHDEGWVAGSLPKEISSDVLADATTLMETEQSRTLEYDGMEVFIETLAPPPRLVIFGAVDVAQNLSTLAKHLGFHVTVNDARPAFTTEERFPEADRVLVGWPDEVAADLPLDRRTYVVILSHDSRFEDPVFRRVRDAPIRYLGAMGSRRTHARRVEKLKAAGWTDEQIARVHGPVGLDIGAETPAEVAVSILAEIIQIRYGAGTGKPLRGRQGRIHLQREDDTDPSAP